MIERALAAGVGRMLAIGTGNGPPDLEAGLRLAREYPFLYATVGVHPHDAAKATPETFAAMQALLGDEKVLAVGEIGLDYTRRTRRCRWPQLTADARWRTEMAARDGRGTR